MRITKPQLLFSALLGAIAIAGVTSVARAEDQPHSRYMLAYSYGVKCQDDRTPDPCPT